MTTATPDPFNNGAPLDPLDNLHPRATVAGLLPSSEGAVAQPTRHEGFCAYEHGGVFCRACDLATIEPDLAAPSAAIAARKQEDIEPQPHHPGRWIDKQNPGWSFPSKEAAFAARGQETINTARLAWLHTSNKDAEGYEYGVCKVKFDAAGKLESFLWTASDSSDVDAAMTAAGSVA